MRAASTSRRWSRAALCAGTGTSIGQSILPVGYGGTSSTAMEWPGEEAVGGRDLSGWERKLLLGALLA